jgi:hypothetical protein
MISSAVGKDGKKPSKSAKDSLTNKWNEERRPSHSSKLDKFFKPSSIVEPQLAKVEPQ